MEYRTLMVHLEFNGDNEGVLKIAGELAERFKSKVIGIAAAQPVKILYDEACTAGEIMAEDQAEIDKELNACARSVSRGTGRPGQKSGVAFDRHFRRFDDYIADQARAADLIITGKDIGGDLLDTTRRVNIGRLAVKAGRPVLLVPQGITSFRSSMSSLPGKMRAKPGGLRWMHCPYWRRQAKRQCLRLPLSATRPRLKNGLRMWRSGWSGIG